MDDSAARAHPASWIRQFVLDGVGGNYVIAYALGARWWTFFFERKGHRAPDGVDCWCVESYAHNGSGWKESYFHWPAEDRWRHVLYLQHGEDYGRFRSA